MSTCDDDFQFIEYPEQWIYEAIKSNRGIGRGVIKSKPRTQYTHVDLYSQWCEYPDRFPSMLHITKEEFDYILQQLEDIMKNHTSQLSMSLPNKLLMALHFVIQYTGGNNLACLFNTSEYYVSKVLDEMFPYLVELFSKYIPNKKIHETRSRLHPKLKYIIDGTIHKTRKSHGGIDVDYNGHYRRHGKLTHILLDYEGYVIAFLTNIKGKAHDSIIATYNKDFRKIVGSDFALGDPGFEGVGYVVSGFKPVHVKTWSQFVFDTISRREQVLIENINKAIKECKSVNKEDTFKHGSHRLLACVFISIGLYNMKKSWGYHQYQ